MEADFGPGDQLATVGGVGPDQGHLGVSQAKAEEEVTHASHAAETDSRRLHRQEAHTYVPLPRTTAKDTAPCTTSPTLRPRHCRGLRASWRTDVPTYEATPRFITDLDRLTPEQRRRFRQAVTALVHDLRTGGRFRAGLRQSSASAAPRVSTYSPGRATAGQLGRTGRSGYTVPGTSSGAASVPTSSPPVRDRRQGGIRPRPRIGRGRSHRSHLLSPRFPRRRPTHPGCRPPRPNRHQQRRAAGCAAYCDASWEASSAGPSPPHGRGATASRSLRTASTRSSGRAGSLSSTAATGTRTSARRPGGASRKPARSQVLEVWPRARSSANARSR